MASNEKRARAIQAIMDAIAHLVPTGGGNPNEVQVITGTADNPWGDVDLDALYNALAGNGATAKIVFNVSGTVISAFLEAAEPEGFKSLRGIIAASPAFVEAEVAEWNINGTVKWFAVASGPGGAYQVNDYTAIASYVTTTLTIIWHPLPQ